MIEQTQAHAEEVLRTLSAATAAVRLYPPTSQLPLQAIERLVESANAVTHDTGHLRYLVEPKAFKYTDVLIGESNAQISSLAETLYAHQVGQLIIAPDIRPDEAMTFVRCVAADPKAAREEGGLRSIIVGAGVTHIAVIELTLRASKEDGIAGMDLASVPLEAIGPEVVRAAAKWARSAAAGQGVDDVGSVIGSLETAARDLAASRVAQALMRLDESTRVAVLIAAFRTDSSGKRMEGVFDIVAQMNPATLARLLILVAARGNAEPSGLLSQLRLPPEAMRAIALLMRPSAETDPTRGIPTEEPDIAGIVDEVEAEEEADADMEDRLADAAPRLAASRGLHTTLALARISPTAESVAAVGEAMLGALRAGAFEAVRDGLTFFEGAATDPQLTSAIGRARAGLADTAVLAEAMSLARAASPADVAAVLVAAGPTSADVAMSVWVDAEQDDRSALERAFALMPEAVITAAGRRLRTSDPFEAVQLIDLLTVVGDRRAVPALRQTLDNAFPEVRLAALTALSRLGSEEAWRTVYEALRSDEPSTARHALALVRAADARGAIPVMVDIAAGRASGNRSREVKREIIDCLGAMRAEEARPVLRRLAGKRFAFGKAAKELRDAARAALVAMG
jgi:HEAT repeats